MCDLKTLQMNVRIVKFGDLCFISLKWTKATEASKNFCCAKDEATVDLLYRNLRVQEILLGLQGQVGLKAWMLRLQSIEENLVSSTWDFTVKWGFITFSNLGKSIQSCKIVSHFFLAFCDKRKKRGDWKPWLMLPIHLDFNIWLQQSQQSYIKFYKTRFCIE